MKSILVLSVLLFAQIALAGPTQSKEKLEEEEILSDARNQIEEIMMIDDSTEFNRRWTGFVNRSNSGPWKAAFLRMDLHPDRLFEHCETHTDSDGNTWCDGFKTINKRGRLRGACPTKETMHSYDKEVEACNTVEKTKADRDSCKNHAKAALGISNLACAISDAFGRSGSDRSGCPAGGNCAAKGCNGPCHEGTGKCNC